MSERLKTATTGSRLAIVLTTMIVTTVVLAGGVALATVGINSVGSPQIKNGTVASVDIKDNNVRSNDIQNGTVASADIANNAVRGLDIKDGTLTDADIADGTITSADIGQGQVTSSEIQNGTILDVDIRNGTIKSADIANGTIKPRDLSPGTLTNSVIPSGQTVTGNVIWRTAVGVDNVATAVYVPFPARAPADPGNLNINFASDITADTTDDDAACGGTVAAPTAPAGKVCIYRNAHGGLDQAQGLSPTSFALLGDRGFVVEWISDGSANTSMFLYATWAYTAP